MGAKKAIFSVRPFEKLKKKIESKTAVPRPAHSSTKEKGTLHRRRAVQSRHGCGPENEAFRSLACAHRPRKIAVRAGKADPDCEAVAILKR